VSEVAKAYLPGTFNAGERISEMISSGSEWSDIWKSEITYLNTKKSVVYFCLCSETATGSLLAARNDEKGGHAGVTAT
jgi:hypothetical protein